MVNMSAVWDRSIEFVSDNLAALAPIALAAILLPLTINGSLSPLSAEVGQGARIGLGVLTLVLALASSWGKLAVIAMALDPRLSTGGAARRATSCFGSFLLVALLLLAGGLLLVAPVAVILAAYGYDLAAAMQNDGGEIAPIAVIWSVLYVMALIPVLIWIAARLALVTVAVVGEGLGLSAIGRSIALTRGLTIRILGVMILYVILVVVVTFALQAGFGSILRIIVGGEGVTIATVVTAAIVAAASTVFAVLESAFLAKLYVASLTRENAVPSAPAR